MEEYVRRICVRGIIYKNGKLFCQELKNNAGTGKGFWCTPGGGLEPGEALVAGLRRELIEETGVEPVIGKLLFIQQFSKGEPTGDYGAHEFLEFLFHIENPDDFETIDENASHYEAEVFSCAFVDQKTSNVLPEFLQTVDLEAYISSDKPPLVYAEFSDSN